MNQQQIFYKLVTANTTSFYLDKFKTDLERDLYATADDPVLFRRRFRMISQLADYQSQIYKKIYNFTSDDMNDYIDVIKLIIDEIYIVTSKNG